MSANRVKESACVCFGINRERARAGAKRVERRLIEIDRESLGELEVTSGRQTVGGGRRTEGGEVEFPMSRQGCSAEARVHRL